MKKFHAGYKERITKVQLLNSNVWRMIKLISDDRSKILVDGVDNPIRPTQIKKLSNNL